MKIGVPRERKTLEKRVAITPSGASELVRRGHTVLIEKGAGAGSFFDDAEYIAAGAKMAGTLQEVWTHSDMVVKVKEPHESEFKFFRPGLVLFDYLHLASIPETAKALAESKVTGIAYELVQMEDRSLPLLEPMSEVAGKLSILLGSYYLLSQNGGRGVLLDGTNTVAPAVVTIVGAGVAGLAACEGALGHGANVTILDIDSKKLERVRHYFEGRVHTIYSTPMTIEQECARSDLVIGAVLVPGAAAPKIIPRSTIARMRKGSVFVDISIDQGGCAETSRPTSLEDPVYVEEGVTHYGVCNMPAQTPRTSTMALTNATLPYVCHIADFGFKGAIEKFTELRAAVNTCNGYISNEACAKSLNMPFKAAL